MHFWSSASTQLMPVVAKKVLFIDEAEMSLEEIAEEIASEETRAAK